MKYFLSVLFLLNYFILSGQTVINTSYTTQTDEKVLRLEFVLPLDKNEAWHLFTTDEQLKKWIAPLAHIELKTGGYILTNYDKTKSLADSSSIKLNIINYLEQEQITLKVKLNDNFPKSIQNEDGNLQEIIQFVKVGPKSTKIISSMIGWGQGEQWTNAYNFFVKGNIYTYKELIKLFK
ncbi:MAG: hypothetical protein ABI390_05905 [Daejeonella sp.]